VGWTIVKTICLRRFSGTKLSAGESCTIVSTTEETAVLDAEMARAPARRS